MLSSELQGLLFGAFLQSQVRATYCSHSATSSICYSRACVLGDGSVMLSGRDTTETDPSVSDGVVTELIES